MTKEVTTHAGYASEMPENQVRIYHSRFWGDMTWANEVAFSLVLKDWYWNFEYGESNIWKDTTQYKSNIYWFIISMHNNKKNDL